MRQIFGILFIITTLAISVTAQSESELKKQSSEQAAGFVRNRVVHLGPRTTYLKQGLSTEQVRKLLGEPSSVVERSEGGKIISTYEFPRGDGRVLIAEFVGDALVDSRTETRSAAALASLNPYARAS